MKIITNIKYQIRKKQADYYINKLHYPFDSEWFRNKRVALIGGADSVLQQKLCDFIDDFEVVVRINKGVELIDTQKEFVGTKTDVLFHSFYENPKEIGSSPITTDLWKKHKVQHIVYSKNYKIAKEGIYDIILFGKKSGGETKFSTLTKNFHEKSLNAMAPYRPTTGFIALNTILNCNPKELYLSGITFFKTPHNDFYRQENIEKFKENFNNSPQSHNPEKEFTYFKNLYLQNKSIIKLDTVLDEIINQN